MDETAKNDEIAKSDDNDSDLTRREFLKQAAYGTAALSGVLLLSGTGARAAAQDPESSEWARFGRWQVRGGTHGTNGVIGIHAALLSVGDDRGRVLFFSYGGDDYTDNIPGISCIWDPETGSVVPGSEDEVALNPFCSGHAFSTYGNLLVVGGHHPPRP